MFVASEIRDDKRNDRLRLRHRDALQSALAENALTDFPFA